MRTFGIAVFTRRPLREVRIEDLADARIPTVIGRLDLDGASLHLVATHPPSPLFPSNLRVRNRQLEALARVASDRTGLVVIVGDLNTTMWSPYYKDLIAQAELRNAREGFGLLPTWPAWLPAPLRIPIDHVLHSAGVEVIDCRVGPPVGSDHLPLIVDLAIPETD